MVCTGNICRSPMAEALLAGRLAGRTPSVRVESAGVAALVGQPADPMACELMRERGLDLSGHRARQLTPEMVYASDLVLTMDTSLKRWVEQLVSGTVGRVHRIGRWGNFDVPDPFGKPRPAFEYALALIEDGLDDFMRVFWSEK
jgi:protein-tyrosine phosphatase